MMMIWLVFGLQGVAFKGGRAGLKVMLQGGGGEVEGMVLAREVPKVCIFAILCLKSGGKNCFRRWT